MTVREREELIGPEEAATILGIEVATLYSWRHRKMGPKSYSVGRKVKYKASDIDRWLEERSKPGRP
jgi:excisionase family DNA binding protein